MLIDLVQQFSPNGILKHLDQNIETLYQDLESIHLKAIEHK